MASGHCWNLWQPSGWCWVCRGWTGSRAARLVEVFFRGRVYHFGTVFSGQVFDRERPLEVGQFVEDGDATFRLGQQPAVRGH